jgi:DNA uptake protein ComE-like DNA-binding protein
MSLRAYGQCFLILSALLLLLSLGGCGTTGERAQNNSAQPPTAPSAPSPATETTPHAKLNINTASDAELLKGVPGLGNRMLHEFEEYRPYNSIQQFRREIGKYVDPAQVAEYEKYIFVPIKVNEADAATLMQIPGLDASEAESLISGRPYASPQAFLTKLADKISAADLDIAKTYLANQ